VAAHRIHRVPFRSITPRDQARVGKVNSGRHPDGAARKSAATSRRSILPACSYIKRSTADVGTTTAAIRPQP